MMAEMIHDSPTTRLISEHHPPHTVLWMGDSIAYWEDETLITETRNMHPQQIHYGSSEGPVVTASFTRSTENQMTYPFIMDNPPVYSQPWTAEMPLRKRPEGDMLYGYPRHEGNYA